MRSSTIRGVAVMVLSFVAVMGVVTLSGLPASIAQLARVATAPLAAVTSVATDQQQAVRQTIERSNQAQATAFNTNDPTAMRAYATPSFYQQLRQTNDDLRSSGVTKIELVTTEYRDIAVNGTSASATTFETWRSTYQDGSVDEATARNVYALVLDGSEWRVASDDQPSAVARDGAAPAPAVSIPTAAQSSSTSSNWSGYAATGGTFTSVSGTWSVPSVTATASGADATWVGIGGIDTRDLIQAGTEAIVQDGAVEYQAWIELLPAPSRPVSLAVSAGDSVTVTISETSRGQWSIEIRNDTTGARYATTVHYASTRSSAEWVEEAPSIGRATVALDQFGSVTFTGATAVRDGASSGLRGLGAHAISMINGARQTIAQPSVIGSDGSSFTVTRTQAPADTTVPGTGRRPRRG